MAKTTTRERAAAASARGARTSGEDTDDAPVRDTIDYGPLPALIGYRIRKAYSHLFQSFNEMLRDLSLAPGQYSVLLLIGLNPGLNQMMLAEATGIDRSTIVPITNRFAKLGWVRRTRRKGDRRAYSLRLTPLGQSILDQARPIIAEHDERLVASLSPAERQTLTELLSRIGETVEEKKTAPAKSAGRGSRQVGKPKEAAA